MKTKIEPKQQLNDNTVTDTDSYKFSHWNQYPPGTRRMMSYFESRGGDYDTCTLFGLQYLLHRYLSKPITQENVDECERFALAHGEPFNHEGWMHIVDHYNGHLPVRIRAIPEGTIVPVSNAVMTIESVDDPKCFWIVSWLETMLSRLWYPSTIATTSRASKKILLHYLEQTADNPQAEISFKLHDFGGRGVTCVEQARTGGAAHLLSFLGSDTVEGVRCTNHYYDCEMAGFSIPASEHSTMTMWGRTGEYDAFEHYVRKFLIEREVPAGIPKLAACVSDSYDIFEAVEAWTGPRLLPLVKSSGGTLVIRPDSGDPISVLSDIFYLLGTRLSTEITRNQKGFKMLPPYFRVIQGDGIDQVSMERILISLTRLGWSTANIAFGSGGGLLQKVNRDTQKWAFKCCYALIEGRDVDVRKHPITDPGKQSKAGRLDLIMTSDGPKTITLEGDAECHPDSMMNTVFENGDILYNTTFEECRSRMALPVSG